MHWRETLRHEHLQVFGIRWVLVSVTLDKLFCLSVCFFSHLGSWNNYNSTYSTELSLELIVSKAHSKVLGFFWNPWTVICLKLSGPSQVFAVCFVGVQSDGTCRVESIAVAWLLDFQDRRGLQRCEQDDNSQAKRTSLPVPQGSFCWLTVDRKPVGRTEKERKIVKGKKKGRRRGRDVLKTFLLLQQITSNWGA